VNADLHCHSTVSDGALAPAEVVRRAAARGVTLLALTDHDQLGGLQQARAIAAECGIAFLDGVEVSVTWRGVTVHVVGLRVNPQDHALKQGLEQVRGGRVRRARRIGEELAQVGIEGSFEGASALAEDPAMVSRTHFARFLVQQGVVADTREVFRNYLVQGKPGYVPHHWVGACRLASLDKGRGRHRGACAPGSLWPVLGSDGRAAR
jgi:predicted metal-dependent phosphoesterase TrpH